MASARTHYARSRSASPCLSWHSRSPHNDGEAGRVARRCVTSRDARERLASIREADERGELLDARHDLLELVQVTVKLRLELRAVVGLHMSASSRQRSVRRRAAMHLQRETRPRTTRPLHATISGRSTLNIPMRGAFVITSQSTAYLIGFTRLGQARHSYRHRTVTNAQITADATPPAHARVQHLLR